MDDGIECRANGQRMMDAGIDSSSGDTFLPQAHSVSARRRYIFEILFDAAKVLLWSAKMLHGKQKNSSVAIL